MAFESLPFCPSTADHRRKQKYFCSRHAAATSVKADRGKYEFHFCLNLSFFYLCGIDQPIGNNQIISELAVAINLFSGTNMTSPTSCNLEALGGFHHKAVNTCLFKRWYET